MRGTELTLSEPLHDTSGLRSIPTTVFYPAVGTGPARRFPLVVFSPGYDISPHAYDGLLRAWASAGYVVAEPDYPHTAPGSAGGIDEADIVNHPRDLRFVISSLTRGDADLAGAAGLVDPARVAVAGHSDGGDVALAVVAAPCCRLRGLRAAVILSGAELASFGKRYYAPTVPLLVAQGGADTINPPACSTALYAVAPPPRYYLSLPGADHLGPYVGSDSVQGVVARVTTAFLDTYLGGQPSAIGSVAGSVSAPGVLTAGSPLPQAPGGCPGAPGV